MKTANTYPEHNSASAEVLGEVLREVKQLYPSPSYGLVVFSHSSGWLPEGSLGNPKLRATSPPTPKGGVVNSSPLGGRGAGAILQSVIIDNGSEMELPAFAEAIPDGMLDFIIFDACYMAGVEVAYELKDKARYVVASSAEVVSPGFIPVYTTEALSLLFQPKADLQGFCQRIEADYRKRQGDYGSLTLSLISTRGLDDLAAALNNKCFDDNDLKNKIGLTPTGGGTSIQAFDRGGGTLFFDLADSYKELMTGEERTAFQAAIDGCVLWKAATPAFLPNYGGFQVRAHCGLTTYLPQERYPKLNEAYKGLKWSQAIRN